MGREFIHETPTRFVVLAVRVHRPRSRRLCGRRRAASVAVAAPAPFVWIGPGYYGGAYYHAYPGLILWGLLGIAGGSSR